jgi:hypothetical protein
VELNYKDLKKKKIKKKNRKKTVEGVFDKMQRLKTGGYDRMKKIERQLVK